MEAWKTGEQLEDDVFYEDERRRCVLWIMKMVHFD